MVISLSCSGAAAAAKHDRIQGGSETIYQWFAMETDKISVSEGAKNVLRRTSAG